MRYTETSEVQCPTPLHSLVAACVRTLCCVLAPCSSVGTSNTAVLGALASSPHVGPTGSEGSEGEDEWFPHA